MEDRHRSVIFKPSEVNIVDMAADDVVADVYIEMASDIIFQKGRDSDRALNEVFEPHGFSGFKINDSMHNDKII